MSDGHVRDPGNEYILSDLYRTGVGIAFLTLTRTMGYYCATGFSFIPLALYNGKKGKGLKWLFYVLLPGHLILLAAIKYMST